MRSGGQDIYITVVMKLTVYAFVDSPALTRTQLRQGQRSDTYTSTKAKRIEKESPIYSFVTAAELTIPAY